MLLDYLDGAFWTLGFTGSANEAFFNFHGDRFPFFYFVNANWACVDACPTSSTLMVVNYYLYHLPLLFRLDLIQV